MIPFLAQISMRDGELLGISAGAYLVLKIFSEFVREYMKARWPKLNGAANMATSGDGSVAAAMLEVRNIHRSNEAMSTSNHGKTHEGIDRLATCLTGHVAADDIRTTNLLAALDKNSEALNDLRLWLAENIHRK